MVTAEPGAVGLSEARLRRLNDAFQAKVENAEIAGAVVVVGRRGKIAFHEAFGYRDREAGAAMPRDAIFRLSSMTKPLISLAAMILVEEGKLRLDSPAGDILPALKEMKVGVVAKDGALELAPPRRPIMILDLLRHTSGITAGHHGNSPVKHLYANAGLALPTNTRDEFLAKLAQLPLEFEPGSTFAYGLSHDVVGHVIEEVSGLPLDEFIRSRLTGPLGMTDTVFQLPEVCRPRIAEPQIDPATGNRPPMRDPLVRPARFSGQGNMVSSATDWARLCQLLLNGGEVDGIVSRKTVELMTADQLPPDVAFDPAIAATWGPALPGPTFGQGFGFALAVRTHAGRAPWHGSVGDFGWVGSTGVFFWVDPREQLFAILLTQAPSQLIPCFYLMRSLAYAAISG